MFYFTGNTILKQCAPVVTSNSRIDSYGSREVSVNPQYSAIFLDRFFEPFKILVIQLCILKH